MKLKDWKLSKLGEDIWKGKYQYDNESFDEWLNRVSNGDENIKQLIIDKKFLFGGRILANRGLDKLGKKITLSNCYVLPQIEDNIESIYKTSSDLARTFSYGGGVGVDISKLRPKGAIVNNSAETTTGAVSFMDLFSLTTGLIGSRGRRAALMLSMDCSHPDIEEFIDIKTDLEKVTKANISVKVTDEFMNAVVNDLDWELYFKTENNEDIKKTIKAKYLFNKLCENNWNYAEPGLLNWSRINNYSILSEDDEFEFAGVNPCAEETLPAGGSCLLGSFNLSAYVKDGEFKFEEFKKDIHKVVKGMNDVLDEGLPLHPLQIQRDTVRDYRQIGIGIMGIADMLIKLGLKYGEEESIKLCDKIGFELANQSLYSSSILAKESGSYPKYKDCILESNYVNNNTTIDVFNHISEYGLKNSQILTIAPTGSLSTMLGISGGIEPIFENSYIRKTESLHGEDVYYKVYTPIVKEYMDKHNLTTEEELPDYFVTAMSLSPTKRIDMQSVWQNHIDASISSTINLPNSATVEDVYNIYVYAWQKGCKGITVYRSGCKREGILTTDANEEEEVKLLRGDWKSLAEDTYYVKRTLRIGCGSLKLFIGYSPSEKSVQDLYIVKCGNGGCTRNLQALAISMSAVLRLGGTLHNLEKAFKGIDPCNSFISNRAKGIELSKGTYCGAAIINEVNQFLKEVEGNVVVKNTKTKTKEVSSNETCPECGDKINFSGGCVICPSCGYTKCD